MSHLRLQHLSCNVSIYSADGAIYLLIVHLDTLFALIWCLYVAQAVFYDPKVEASQWIEGPSPSQKKKMFYVRPLHIYVF